MRPERGVTVPELLKRRLDRERHRDAGALGVRRRLTVASTEPDRAGELIGDELELRLRRGGAPGIVAAFRMRDLLAELAHALLVLRAGGGIVAVHRALIINPPGDWPWYEKMIGRSFITHPMVQTATVRTIDPSFPAAFGLPARWIWTDEWYEFKPPIVDGLHDVLEVDESSYDPTRIWPGQVATGMGKHHPVAWYHAYDGGRVFATALGHTPASWDDRLFLDHLYGGIWWAATGKGIGAAKR